jgi:hypothetical protein
LEGSPLGAAVGSTLNALGAGAAALAGIVGTASGWIAQKTVDIDAGSVSDARGAAIANEAVAAVERGGAKITGLASKGKSTSVGSASAQWVGTIQQRTAAISISAAVHACAC